MASTPAEIAGLYSLMVVLRSHPTECQNTSRKTRTVLIAIAKIIAKTFALSFRLRQAGRNTSSIMKWRIGKHKLGELVPNDITDRDKKRAVLHSVCGARTYYTIRDPSKPTELAYGEIVTRVQEILQSDTDGDSAALQI